MSFCKLAFLQNTNPAEAFFMLNIAIHSAVNMFISLHDPPKL